MNFGLNFTPVYPAEMLSLALRAEEVGFESLWIGEHVIVPFEQVPEVDRRNFKPNSRFVEPWVALAHLAAVTQRVRLGTCVVVMPMHSPFNLARSIATLDVLSSGRVSVGVGLGMIKAEYDAVRLEYSNRGARMNEMIELLNVLFTEERPEFHGRFYDIPPSGFEPKPIQRPRPPLLVGGFSDAALTRAVELGDGWFGSMPSPERAAALITELQYRREELGRPPLEITLLTGWAHGYDQNLVDGYEEAGVNRLVVTPWTSSRNALEGIEQFAVDAGLG